MTAEIPVCPAEPGPEQEAWLQERVYEHDRKSRQMLDQFAAHMEQLRPGEELDTAKRMQAALLRAYSYPGLLLKSDEPCTREDVDQGIYNVPTATTLPEKPYTPRRLVPGSSGQLFIGDADGITA